MSQIMYNIENMSVNYATTYAADYRHGNITPPVKTAYKEKPKKERSKTKPLKDTHTLSNWKLESIPFNLLHRPKDILQKNPQNVQQRYEKPVDNEKELIRKTRPRLIMTPQVSMDDITDHKARAILCEDIYISSMAKANKEVETEYLSVRAPFIGRTTVPNPITYPTLKAPYVAPEWRMETVSWDNKQKRYYCDHNKEFWLKQAPPKCQMCDETAIVKDLRKLQLRKGRQQ